MRSNSPFPVRNSPYARSRSFSHYSGSTSPFPVNTLPFADTTFSYPGRTPSPHRRSVSRSSLSRGSGLDRVSEGTAQDHPDEETESLLGSSDDTVTASYTRRWYLLMVFSCLALLQTMSWAMWGPISESAESVFSWEDSNITMCIFLGNLSFCLCCIPFSWLMDHKGLRVSMVLSTFSVMAGSGLRCLIHFVPSSYYTWCIYGGQLLNGIAGPVAQGGGALFSNLWFPSNQRATSTAISTFIGYAGNALAFVVGPMLIPSPSDTSNSGNNTLPTGNNNTGGTKQIHVDAGNSSDTGNQSAMMSAILLYLDYQAVAAVALFLLVLVYFPARPPLPPSLSAAADREDFGPGLAKLLKNKQFWLISGAFCLSLGVFEVWDVVLDVNLSTIGISQETAGWLGFYCVMAGCLTGLLICRLADIFFRQIRLFLILSYVVSAIFVLWFLLIYINVLPFDLVSIYAAIILSGVFLDGCCPLVYELICEAAYPVGEGVSSCFLQMLFVLVGMAFAAVQNVPNIGTEWMNWCLLGSLCAAIPLLLCVSDKYGRADLEALDDEVVVVSPPSHPNSLESNTQKAPLTQPKSIPASEQASLLSGTRSGYGSCRTCSPPPILPYSNSGQDYHHYNSGGEGVSHPEASSYRSRSQPNPNRRTSRVTFQDECTDASTIPRRTSSSVQGVRNASYQEYVLNVDRRDSERKDAPSDNDEREGFSDEQRDVFDFEFSGPYTGSVLSHSPQGDVNVVRDSSRDRSLLTSGQHSVDLSFLKVNTDDS